MTTPQCPEFDHMNSAVPGSRVWELYAAMAERSPAAAIPTYGGYLLLNRYQEVREAALMPERFRSGDGIAIPPSGLPPTPPMEFDGQQQKRWRKIMQELLSPGAVRRAASMISAVVEEFLARIPERSEVDLFAEFVEPLPAAVIGRLIGLDQKRVAQMRTVALAAFAAVGTAEMPERMAAFRAFIHEELASRRAAPREDYLTALANGVVGGEEVTEAEVPGVVVAFMLGGHHSTAAAIGNMVIDLLSVPGLRTHLRNTPEDIGAAMEESLRRNPPLQLFARTAAEETEIGGAALSPGDRVMLNYAAACRDPGRYAAPKEFRLHREESGHMAFGAGLHLCQGAALARSQLRTAATALDRRFPDLKLASEPSRTGLVGGSLMTLRELRVHTGTAAA